MSIYSRLFLIVTLFLSISLCTQGQINEDVSSSDTTKLTSIPVAQIPDYRINAENVFFETNRFVDELADLSILSDKILKLSKEIKIKENILDSIDVNSLSTDNLKKWNKVWNDFEKNINDIYAPINQIISTLEEKQKTLSALYDLWLTTSIDIKNSSVPVEVKNIVKKIKLDARHLLKKVKITESSYLSLKYNCNSLLTKVSIKQKLTNEARSNIVKNLLIAEQPLIWNSFMAYYNDSLHTIKHYKIKEISSNTKSYVKTNPSFIYVFFISFLFFIFLIKYIQRTLRHSIRNGLEQTDTIKFILNSHIVISMLFTWMIISSSVYLIVEMKSIIMLIMMMPTLILIRHFFGKQSKSTMVLFILYYLFISTKFIFYSDSILPRLLYMSIAIVSIFLVWYLLKYKKFVNHFNKLYLFIRLTLNVELVIFAISTVFYIIGNVTLATMLLSGAIGTILAGVIIYSVYKLILTIVNLLFNSSHLRKSYIIRNRDNEIKNGIKNILSVLFFIYWVNISLNGFGIKEEIINGFLIFFTHQYQIGNMTFGIDNVVYFFIAIYTSIWISRFILIILNEEVFVRRQTDKGVSGTITLLLRYSILTIGFFFALAVAGINLENISIVIGALGVGIGFGLQDIFNNLISGIILAIERPIKVDDIIQIGELTGVVKDIGFRSSKIKTYDGSEVIVPNGQIVSNQMINWTLSDRKRRLKINLGVSYDSDPEEVIEILKEITANHPNVETNPPPRPRFLGFGDSTLDFQLLFWISDFDNSFGMGTEITIELFKKLKERGIEIPFPKQDITITNITNKESKEDN